MPECSRWIRYGSCLESFSTGYGRQREGSSSWAWNPDNYFKHILQEVSRVSAFWKYLRTVNPHLPWQHWVVMGVLAFASAGIVRWRKKTTVYGAITLGLTVFICLYLLDSLVLVRLCGLVPVWYRTGIDLAAEYDLLLHGGPDRRVEMLANFLVFVPFGLFLSEYLSIMKRLSAWSRLGNVVLAALVLSLCIEILQLVLHVGFFELTDLVMNTVGAVVGAGVSLVGRELHGWGN